LSVPAPKPTLPAVLPETVELMRFNVPLLEIPPPKLAELPEMAELVTVKLPPLFQMPPPPPLTFPPEIVRPEMTAVTPPTSNTRPVLPEATRTVNKFAPGPWMVRFLSIVICPLVRSILRLLPA